MTSGLLVVYDVYEIRWHEAAGLAEDDTAKLLVCSPLVFARLLCSSHCWCVIDLVLVYSCNF